MLTQHVVDDSSFFLYYGSRRAQPARVRAFIDLAVARLMDNRVYVLSDAELSDAEAAGRQAHVRQ